MYLTEIAPVNIRGAMGVLHQLALTIGILISQLLGLRQILGREETWPLLLACSAVPFISCVCVLPFYPDSPRWLLVKKGNEEEAATGSCYTGMETYSDQQIPLPAIFYSDSLLATSC